jgi:hemerythrin-like domain-containing protein
MPPREPKNPRVILLEDHRRIDGLFDRLVAAVRSGDREATERAFKRSEEAILRHLDVEEMFVFPALREGHAKEIDRLRRDHDEIRKQLGELGLALELHTIRADAVESFAAMLREHAEREESLAYVQAGHTLSIGVARSIAARIKQSVSRLRAKHGPDGAVRSAT